MRLVPSLFKGCQAQSPVDTPPTTAVSVQGEACEKLQGVKGLLSVPKVVSLCFKKNEHLCGKMNDCGQESL